jgi:predicted phosphodiesterase
LAPGLNPTQIYVSWIDQTWNPNPCVKINKFTYCTQSKKIPTYTFGKYTSKFITHILVDGLEYQTEYKYQIVGSDFVSYFTTGPDPVDNFTQHIGVVGDIGQTSDSVQTIQGLGAHPGINLVLHAGDLSYADCDQNLWDTYGKLIEPVASRIPWAVGPGNHEIEYLDNSTQLYLSFESRYQVPEIKPAEFGKVIIPSAINPSTSKPYCCPSTFMSEYNYGNSFYSFDSGLVHIIYINPYTPSDPSSPQYKWLETDLVKANKIRNLIPWIIIVTHCPWYNSNRAHQNETQTLQMLKSFEPLVYKYQVNLIISGHVHAYERTYPVYNSVVNQTQSSYAGPTYIVIGDGGNLEGHASTYIKPQPSWSAYTNGTAYGYGILTIKKENIKWSWYRNQDRVFKVSDTTTINLNV